MTDFPSTRSLSLATCRCARALRHGHLSAGRELKTALNYWHIIADDSKRAHTESDENPFLTRFPPALTKLCYLPPRGVVAAYRLLVDAPPKPRTTPPKKLKEVKSWVVWLDKTSYLGRWGKLKGDTWSPGYYTSCGT